jgi:allophanate hydrolase subunit 2
MACTLTATFAGPMISLQDKGRGGFARFGVPASGPMDPAALAVVNAALGNPPGTCGVEISLGGLQLDCTAGAVTFAVAGGGFQVLLDGKLRAPWTVATICAGQRLQIRPGAWGSWAMLGFAGGAPGTAWLGSLSTHSQSGLGGGYLSTRPRW